jgi:hypothetical protein
MRFWTNEIDTHEFISDRQEKDVALLKQLTLEECQNHFMQLLHLQHAKRLDIHWNSKSHRPAEEEAQILISFYDYSGSETREEKFESFEELKQAMGKFDDQHKIKLVKAGQERITMNNK